MNYKTFMLLIFLIGIESQSIGQIIELKTGYHSETSKIDKKNYKLQNRINKYFYMKGKKDGS